MKEYYFTTNNVIQGKGDIKNFMYKSLHLVLSGLGRCVQQDDIDKHLRMPAAAATLLSFTLINEESIYTRRDSQLHGKLLENL